MLSNTFVDSAKVMAKGQITIPKDVRDVLGVSSGDRVTFIVEGNTVRIVNSAVYAMQMLQQEITEMQGRDVNDRPVFQAAEIPPALSPDKLPAFFFSGFLLSPEVLPL